MKLECQNRLKILITLIGIITFGQISVMKADDRAKREYFESHVRPLLFSKCFKCHGSKKQEGGLRTDLLKSLIEGGDTGPAIVPGKPEESELILAINYDADSYQMPPEGKLSQKQINILTEWVKKGAYWPEGDKTHSSSPKEKKFDLKERARHWSFQPVINQPVPSVINKNWPKTPVDNFVLSKLEAAHLSPAKNADKRTLLRRITFDLIGLPPTFEEMNHFLNDHSSNAYSKVVERLLASPHYGERWARHWLDLVRYSETLGHEFDYPIYNSYPYRDYVIRAFNEDLPYSQFVTEHIAGDLLDSPRRNKKENFNESVIGTGFYWFGQGKHSPVDIGAEEADIIDNQIDVLSKTFLGLTVSCARCHDHKFDPITTKDYYALSGYLQSSRKQYTYIEHPEKINSKILQIEKLKTNSSKQIKTDIYWKLVKKINSLDQELLNSINPSLQNKQISKLWNKLINCKTEKEYLAEKNKILDSVKKTSQNKSGQSNTTVFEEFNHSYQGDWFVNGPAFGTTPTQKLDFVFSTNKENLSDLDQLVSPGVAHSGLIANKLRGTIQSKTFTITEPYVFYRALKSGGRTSSGTRYKQGQISLIINGFEIIQNPIYGQLSLKIALDGKFRWYQQDVSKWIGQKAYIEINDDDNGYIAVDEIRFGKNIPTTIMNPLALSLLNNPEIKTREELAKAYEKLLTKTMTQWNNQPTTLSSDQVELINQTLKTSVSSKNQNDTAKSKWITQYKKIESTIHYTRKVVAISDGTSENESVFIRGNHKKKGAVVPRRFLEVFNIKESQSEKVGSGRLELAQNMIRSDNPLLARVMVNRIWHHHFGKGIVQTPDDFGKMGKPPTHPELLDYLATEFINNGGSIKKMHRMMVLSRTYQMSSQLADQKTEDLDPENILLHRMSIKRLEAEVIRDSILAASGELDKKMYGPSIPPYLTPFMVGRGRPEKTGPLDGEGRRSIYINVRRNFLTPMFLAFDYPTPFSTLGRRSASNVPAQGLIMMNNPFVIQQAKLWAEKILNEEANSTDSQVQNIYKQAFGRSPKENELKAAREFLPLPDEKLTTEQKLQRWTDFCHVIFNVKEFIFVN